MKIYTRTGDSGRSSLFSGERVAKHHPRIQAYGAVDELNATIGAVVAVLPDGTGDTCAFLQQIQSDLFRAGAVLATTPESGRLHQIRSIGPGDIRRLEDAIDELQGSLPPLRHFILPGGHPAAAAAHVARTVCRRTERRVAELEGAGEPVPGGEPSPVSRVLIYINRLSDYLFVVARHCNAVAGVDDVIWEG
jgi:cob(I)alamin adenosyltransferase